MDLKIVPFANIKLFVVQNIFIVVICLRLILKQICFRIYQLIQIFYCRKKLNAFLSRPQWLGRYFQNLLHLQHSKSYYIIVRCFMFATIFDVIHILMPLGSSWKLDSPKVLKPRSLQLYNWLIHKKIDPSHTIWNMICFPQVLRSMIPRECSLLILLLWFLLLIIKRECIFRWRNFKSSCYFKVNERMFTKLYFIVLCVYWERCKARPLQHITLQITEIKCR